MHSQTLQREKEHFYRCCFKSFSTSKILKIHAGDCFDINRKQISRMVEKGKPVQFKNYMRAIKPPSMNSANL